MRKILFHLCLYAAIAGCSMQNKMVQTDLYFGLSKKDGTTISDSAWSLFVRQHVTAVFPEGFTVFCADGKWFSEEDKQLHTEPSRVISHVGRMTRLLSKKTDSLRLLYKKQFGQESVLRVSKKISGSF